MGGDDLHVCMAVMKEALDMVLAEARAASSRGLLVADVKAFGEWLRAEIGLMVLIISHVGDFRAYAATLGVARSFQGMRRNHFPIQGHPPHKFPLAEDVRQFDDTF